MALFEQIQLNDQGSAVKRWQNFLKRLNFLDTQQIDGQFGPRTDIATKNYQSSRGLNADGIVGNQTYQKAREDGFNGGFHEVRATWLTNVDSNVFDSRANIKNALVRLKNMNFNTIYPAVWNRGYTLYPSAVAQAFFGVAVMPPNIPGFNFPPTQFIGRDMMRELLDEAKALGLRVLPWFEYGLMTLPSVELAQRHPDLLMVDMGGNTQRQISHDGNREDIQVWLNPCRPQVQQFFVDLIAEFLEKYPEIDGIQLDDHFGFPVEMSYDDFTVDLFQQEESTTTDPINSSDSLTWRQWRTQKITQLLEQIVTTIKSKNPRYILSLSPNPLDFSRNFYLADWLAWTKSNLVEELVLQVYRDSLAAFKNEITKDEVIECRDIIPTSIGILTGLRNRIVDFQTNIQPQVNEAREQELAGFSCFSFETVINTQVMSPNPSNPQEREIAFRNILPPLA